MKLNKYFSIAIDGPAGSGKSTIAKLFADRCKDFTYINTGSMFRALAYFCNEKKVDINNEKELFEAINSVNIELHNNLVFVSTKDERKEVSNLIRTKEIENITSKISKIKIVRDKLLKDQVLLSQNTNVIMDGRDIGTVVLPNASLKFFLIADLEIRAKRRFEELQLNDVELNEVIEEIKKRDHEDSEREISPLVKAEDAILIDSTNFSILEVLSQIEKEYAKRNKKNILKELKIINNNTNKLISEFIDIYNDVFVKKDLVNYDEVVGLDYKIYDLHNLLICFLEKFSFLKEKIDNDIKALYENVYNEIKIPISEFLKSDKFDILYYSYLLIKIYILIPYIFKSIGLFVCKQKNRQSIERFEYLVKINFVSKYVYLNYFLFKKLDSLELKINNLIEDNNDKHPQSKQNYIEVHKKFINLFNYFILLRDFNINESNIAFKLSFILKNWCYLLLVVISLIAILLVIIILSVR